MRQESFLHGESEGAVQQGQLDADAGVGRAFLTALCHVVIEPSRELHGLRLLAEVGEEMLEGTAYGANRPIATQLVVLLRA